MGQLPQTTLNLQTEASDSLGYENFFHAYELFGPEENTVTQLTKGYQRIREQLADVASPCRTSKDEPHGSANLVGAVIGAMP